MALTHLDAAGDPQMVDVGGKAVTRRTATARATVVLGPEIMAELAAGDFNVKKGSVRQTAILAATMAVKQTWATIPLCHPLPITGCNVEVLGPEAGAMGDGEEQGEELRHALVVRCTVKTEGKTGVEMEALHGATVGALTIYDMCKAMSHAIRITDVRLVEKRGGKSDYG